MNVSPWVLAGAPEESTGDPELDKILKRQQFRRMQDEIMRKKQQDLEERGGWKETWEPGFPKGFA